MSKLFLTDPDNPNPKEKARKKTTFDFREGVSAHLRNLGVPFRPSELAVIDFRQMIANCYHSKLNAEQTASFMFGEIFDIYTTDGIWHYAPS